MENTQQQNAAPLSLAALVSAFASISNRLTVEEIIALTFGTPEFKSSVGDPFETKNPNGGADKWSGKRVASCTVPILLLGVDIGASFACTVYRDVSPDGENYAVRASLPSVGKYQSAFSGNTQILDRLKYHIADHADQWLEQQARIARPTATPQAASQPRLVVRKVTKPGSTPALDPNAVKGMTAEQFDALKSQVAEAASAGQPITPAVEAVNAGQAPAETPAEVKTGKTRK